MTVRTLLVLLVVAFLSGPRSLTGSVDLSEAGRLLSSRDWQAAEHALDAILEQHPDHANASALLGFCLFHQARYDECIGLLEAARTAQSGYAARVLYYLGLAYAENNNRDASAAAFAELLLKYPHSEEARRVEGAGVAPEDASQDREGVDVQGSLVSLEAGLNSNPDLSTASSSDMMLNVFASSDFAFDDLPVLMGASCFLEKYGDQTENDYLELAIDLNRSFLLSDAAAFDGAVELSQSWVDFSGYERTLSLIGDWDRTWNVDWRTSVRGSVGKVSAEDDSTSDGTDLRFRVRSYRYLDPEAAMQRVRLQLQLKEADRDVSADAYGSVLMGVEGRWALNNDMTLDAGLDYEDRSYDGPDAIGGPARSEDIIDLSGYLTRRLSDRLDVFVQSILTSRSSNVSFYDADAFQLSAGLMWVP